MKEKKTQGIWRITSVILLVLLVGSLYYFTTPQGKGSIECESYKTCPDRIEDKAILDVELYQWAENLYNSSEMFFDYWIMNYGDVEAKNVKVKCRVIDNQTNVRTSGTGDYGNLASRSVEFGEVMTDNFHSNDGDKFVPFCYIESCDNCEILYKRIPDLVESYGGGN